MDELKEVFWAIFEGGLNVIDEIEGVYEVWLKVFKIELV